MKFLKANINKVSVIFGFIALALVLPTFINYLSYDDLSDYQIIKLISYGLLSLSAIVFIVIGYQNKISILGLELAVAFFLLSNIVIDVYEVLKNSERDNIPSIMWSIICLVLITISINKQKLNLFTVIFMGIVIAYDLASMFEFLGDKYISLSRLVLGLLSLFYYYTISTTYIRNYNDDNDSYFN